MALAAEDSSEPQFEVKFREDEEMEFFTELALHETERWITAVTKKTFAHPDDPRRSLENGILLCELLNCLKPGTVKRINRLPTPIAGLDNLHIFLKACREHFGLNNTQLFDQTDLEDLSQRAIAESGHLKEELDKRLRNVAVTIYWLGRSVSQLYPGPKIDQSAFAALVHRSGGLLGEGQVLRGSSCSWESDGHSSASGSMKDTVLQRSNHIRDSSYDSNTSYGKASEDSLEGLSFEVDETGMPISRYDSASALNRSGDSSSRRAGAGSSVYGYDKGSALYRSSPDLSSGHSNRRSSSADSADSSFLSHSRQSSDSADNGPSRRLSTHLLSRRTSSSTDPLQFVKSKGAMELAITAEEQIRLAAETKKMTPVARKEEDSNDWLSNLASWKNRRKSQSEKSYQLKEELEEMEREKEEIKTSLEQPVVAAKTYSQMKEERERRKSTGNKHFYPIEDEEEEDLFTPSVAENLESRYAQRTYQHTQGTQERGTRMAGKVQDIADWAKDSDNDKEEEKKNSREDRNNNKYEPSTKLGVSRYRGDSEVMSLKSDLSSRPPRSGLSDRNVMHMDSSGSQRSHAESSESVSKENSRNSGSAPTSKSASRISSIIKSFDKDEEEDEDTAKPKSSVRASVDISGSMKPLEKGASQGVSKIVDSYHSSWSTDGDHRVVPRGIARDDQMRPSGGTVYASTRNIGKDFVEKTIKISQKPNSEKGFGFSLSGGADKKQVTVVEKVRLGSAADVCELQAKDEVVAINGQSVARLTSAELEQKVRDAVSVGQIELRVKRYLGSRGGDLEDDYLSSDEDVDTPYQTASKSSGRGENSFDSLDSREDTQKVDEGTSITSQLEKERKWLEAQIENTVPALTQSKRRGDPAQTSSDSGYDAQTFTQHPYRGDNSSNDEEVGSQEVVVESVKYSLQPQEMEHSDTVVVQVRPRPRERGRLQKQPDAVPSEEVAVEVRPAITVRKEVIEDRRGVDNKGDRSSVASFESVSEGPSSSTHKNQVQQDSDSSGSGFQPPAVLRKWQRQRVREEYRFESDDPPQIYSQIKLSAAMPQQSSIEQSTEKGRLSRDEMILNKASEDYSATMQIQPPLVASKHTFDSVGDQHKMEEWGQKQEDERQRDRNRTSQSENGGEVQFQFDQRQFLAHQEQMKQQYEVDLQRAAKHEQDKKKEEQELLDPEMEKMRKLEERRAQRRARLMQQGEDSADSAVVSPSRPSATALEPRHHAQQPQTAMETHTSTMSMQIPPKNLGQQSGILVIDPRNCGDDASRLSEVGSAGQQYQFQLKINQVETPHGLLVSTQPVMFLPTDQKAFFEAERERIRQEEMRKIEEDRRRQEEEDLRRLRSKEEELRRQEEMLKQQQVRLKEEQERLERERRQLKQQQLPPAQIVQEPVVSPLTSHNVQSEPSLKFETVTSRIRGELPTFTSSVVAGPRRSEGQPQSFNVSSPSNRVRETSGAYGAQKSEPTRNTKSNNFSQPPSRRAENQSAASAGHSSLPRWPPGPQNQEDRRSSTLPQDSSARQLSREDMVAMNKRATPLQTKPLSPTNTPSDMASTSKPIKREPPSKGQLHSLNSVPRAKFRNPDEWIGSSKDGDDFSTVLEYGAADERQQSSVPPQHLEMSRKQFTSPQDHWLVQEAERRRLHESSERQGSARSQYSGPIRPAADRLDNRWREGGQEQSISANMPAQIRQTLLQKTAVARGSNSSASSQDVNPTPYSQHQPSYMSPNSFSQTLPANFGYSTEPRSDIVPPSHRPPSPDMYRENGLPVSGKQRCSYCSQELGFGAAMVIESLNLYYHVQCFRCYVCHTPLGNGTEGADVRVRVNKLHCPNCYSNDEAGLKFSKV